LLTSENQKLFDTWIKNFFWYVYIQIFQKCQETIFSIFSTDLKHCKKFSLYLKHVATRSIIQRPRKWSKLYNWCHYKSWVSTTNIKTTN